MVSDNVLAARPSLHSRDMVNRRTKKQGSRGVAKRKAATASGTSRGANKGAAKRKQGTVKPIGGSAGVEEKGPKVRKWEVDAEEEEEEEEEKEEEEEGEVVSGSARGNSENDASDGGNDVDRQPAKGKAAGKAKAGGKKLELVCAICAESSSTKKWFMVRHDLRGGHDIPEGNVCFECGSVAESFPAKDFDAVVLEYKKDAAFRRQFKQALACFRGQAPKDWRQSTVQACALVGMRIEHVVAFVEESTFERFTLKRMKDLSLAKVSMPDVEGNMQDGVLLKMQGLPAELVFQKVTLYYDKRSAHAEYLVSMDSAVREQQGEETFKFLNAELVGNRPGALKASAVPKVLSYKDIEEKVAQADQKLAEKELAQRRAAEAAEAAEADGDAGSAGAAAAAASTVVSAGRLRKRLAMEEEQSAKKKKQNAAAKRSMLLRSKGGLGDGFPPSAAASVRLVTFCFYVVGPALLTEYSTLRAPSQDSLLVQGSQPERPPCVGQLRDVGAHAPCESGGRHTSSVLKIESQVK